MEQGGDFFVASRIRLFGEVDIHLGILELFAGRGAAWAMRWFTEIQAGRTGRSQYAPGFVAEVTDEAVKTMSRDLNKYRASPLRAEIAESRKEGDQTFYIIKFVFPRGDATSVLFGFDAAGKITGIAVESLAGD